MSSAAPSASRPWRAAAARSRSMPASAWSGVVRPQRGESGSPGRERQYGIRAGFGVCHLTPPSAEAPEGASHVRRRIPESPAGDHAGLPARRGLRIDNPQRRRYTAVKRRAEARTTVELKDVILKLAKLGTPVLPAVAGITITEHAAAMARSRNVWQILDGHAIEPPAGAPATP